MKFGEYVQYLLLLLFAPRSTKTMEWRMLRLLNKDRKNHGLNSVVMQDDLRSVARKHSLDMAQKDYFDHVNPKGKSPGDRLKLSRITDVTSGENLAKIGGYKNPTQFAEEGLMNSPGHRANILNARYNAVGIGVIRDETGVYYFTQNFARRDIIFKGKLPQRVKSHSGLFLRGKIFTDVKHLYVRVTYPVSSEVVKEMNYSLKERNFSFSVPISEPGFYDVAIFVDHEGQGTHTLANKFQIRVKKGLLW